MTIPKSIEPIDLQEHFGERYRVTYEESYFGEYGDNAHVRDPWLMQIRGRYGTISPNGGETLAVSTHSLGNVARALRRLPCCQVWQDGSDGVTFLFPAAAFPKVAKLVRPHRKPRLTPEQRQANRERLAKYAFRPRCLGGPERQTSPSAALIDILPVQPQPTPLVT
jgi:hypothetical protein